MTTLDRIRNIVAQNRSISVENVAAENTLLDDLGMDEIDRLDLVFEIEVTFGIDLTDAEIETFRTVGDIAKHVDTLRVPALNGAVT